MGPLTRMEARAKQDSQAVALVHAGRHYTGAELVSAVRSLSARLHADGLGPGSRSVIVFDGQFPLLELVAMLALCRLGATSCSIQAHALAAHLPLLSTLGFDSAVSTNDVTFAAAATARGLRVRPIRQADLEPAPGVVPEATSADFLARVHFSSGSTGRPKPIPIPASSLVQRADRFAGQLGFSPGARALLLFNAYVAPGSTGPLAALTAGASLHLPTSDEWDDVWSYMRRERITHLSAPPFFLGELLEHQPQVARPNDLERVNVMGARCPVDVYIKAIERLGPVPIMNLFGSTEVGIVACGELSEERIREGVVGPLESFAQVQCVDANHEPLPPGTPGLLRMRSELMATEYLGDPDATARIFRDGWFYTGDLAVLRDGQLVVVERTTEVANYGGRKVSLTEIDQTAKAQAGVADACAFVYANPKGHDEPWLAIVRDPATPLDGDALFAAIERSGDTVAGMWEVQRIPRNNGKPQRWTLASEFALARVS